MREDPPLPERPRRWWLYGAMLAAGVAGYAWTLDYDPKEPSASVLSSQPQEVPGRAPSPFGNGAVVDSPDRLPEAAPSSDVAAAAASTPSSAAIAAVADPVEMRARFDALRWSGEQPAALAALAGQINAQLPSLVERGAVNVGDALELKADLLDVLEPDPGRRRMQL
ncbi:MAG: hypothetical protein JWP52_3767, partial [Rhizobacter sp.]|nr:hypothetical protein [Rhizobacter sp.]